jgi:hypothetical protein
MEVVEVSNLEGKLLMAANRPNNTNWSKKIDIILTNRLRRDTINALSLMIDPTFISITTWMEAFNQKSVQAHTQQATHKVWHTHAPTINDISPGGY